MSDRNEREIIDRLDNLAMTLRDLLEAVDAGADRDRRLRALEARLEAVEMTLCPKPTPSDETGA